MNTKVFLGTWIGHWLPVWILVVAIALILRTPNVLGGPSSSRIMTQIVLGFLFALLLIFVYIALSVS